MANEKHTESQFLEAEEILDEENSDESKVLKCTKCDEGFSTLVDLAYHQNSAHAKSGIEVCNLGHILSEQHRRLKIDPSFQKSVNLQYITLGCLDNGTKELSTKSLMFQVLFFL